MADLERGLSFSGELSEKVRLLGAAVGGYLSDTEYDLESYIQNSKQKYHTLQ